MNIELKMVLPEEKATLKNIMQYYFYDFSEFIDIDLSENGYFSEYPNLDLYWIEENRIPFLIRVNDKLAGFVLVRRIDEETHSYYSIAEFFVMKKYRKIGLGKTTALKVFDMFKGNWKVHQIERNLPAQTFWTKIIAEYTNDRFTDRFENGKRIQEFTSIK